MENKIADNKTHLLTVIRKFISDFKSERALDNINLSASIERDLGIDSLSRVELFSRIEKAFNVRFTNTMLAEANTVKDILDYIQQCPVTGTVQRPSSASNSFIEALDKTQLNTTNNTTLVEVLLNRAEKEPERPHVYLQNEEGKEEIIRYGQLLKSAQKTAAGLHALGLQTGETVAIMLPTSTDFLYAFLGVLLAGGIPVPIYPPLRADRIEEYALREATILNNAEVRFLITFSKTENLGKLLKAFIKSLHTVTTIPTLMNIEAPIPHIQISENDPALIQYTSGSTSDPKGVLLTHKNVLSNLQAIGKAIALNSTDVGVTWLPLYHDMGLIGSWLGSVYHAFPLTLLSPLSFLNRPEQWLWAIHYHRATLSAGPNFAYELCVRKITEKSIEGLDLSSWRLAFNGAEAVNPKTLERFIKKFEPYGLKPEVLFPVYGLAESTVALTFPPLNRIPRIDTISRDSFEKHQKATPSKSTEVHPLQFVSCGLPLPEHQVKIVDNKGHEVEERIIGNLYFKGPSSMQGYYRNQEATASVLHEGWWESGDFAYKAEGEIFITGRKKDSIIKAGRNLYPQEIEEVTAKVNGIRKGCVVALGVNDPKWGTEKLIIVAETAETKPSIKTKLIVDIQQAVSQALNLPPDEIVLVPPRTIPKTSSGKLQRSRCKEWYLSGKLSKKGMPVWFQLSKLFIKGLFINLTNQLYKLGNIGYTVYIGLLLILLTPIFCVSLWIIPKKCSKYWKTLTNLFLKMTFLPINIKGLKNITLEKPMIYISNHTSYIDALLLKKILPADVLFIAKKELKHWPILGRHLEKLGILIIDREDFSKNLEDTKTFSQRLQEGHSIVIFPEGTFSYTAGLRPFKSGAFKLAVDTKVPLCPISLQGARHIMRDNLLLRPSSITITVGKPLYPLKTDWEEVVRLHTEARTEIAKHCGEAIIDLVSANIVKKQV